MSEATLLEIADSLYAGPLGDFTASRDAEAKAIIKDSGDRELAARVKALKKPSLAAWVVNLLVRREGDQIAEVLKVAEGLRAAQTAMDGDQLRALTRQRRQLTAAVTTRARALAAEDGVRVTSSVCRTDRGDPDGGPAECRCGRRVADRTSGRTADAHRRRGEEPAVGSGSPRGARLRANRGGNGQVAGSSGSGRRGEGSAKPYGSPGKRRLATAQEQVRTARAEHRVAREGGRQPAGTHPAEPSGDGRAESTTERSGVRVGATRR